MANKITLQDRFRGAMVGLACGDVIGVPFEWHKRDTFKATDMTTSQFSDDTAMALCLANSLIEKGFDLADQMDKYSAWAYDGYIDKKSVGGIGKQTAAAIQRYFHNKIPDGGDTDPAAGGNGSIMRLVPVVLYSHPSRVAVITNSAQSSKTTHGSPETVEACMVMGEVIYKALNGENKEACTSDLFSYIESPKILAIKNGSYKTKKREDVHGTGYVVDSLEASLWCFHNTDNFRDAVLMAVNMGDDADTTGAIVGQIAGAFYGMSTIPTNWVNSISQSKMIVSLADKLYGIKARNEKG